MEQRVRGKENYLTSGPGLVDRDLPKTLFDSPTNERCAVFCLRIF